VFPIPVMADVFMIIIHFVFAFVVYVRWH